MLGPGVGFYLSQFDAFARYRRDRSQSGDSLIMAMVVLAHAEQAGIDVHEREVGSFIRKHQEFAEAAKAGKEELKKAYRRYIDAQQMSTAQFERGVREWLKIIKFMQLMNETALATTETAFTQHAMRYAKFTYEQLEVRTTEEMRKQALEDLKGITKDNPEGDPELAMRAMEDYLLEHQDNRAFWGPAKWRFEYVLAPLAAFTPKITEEELREHHKKNGWRFDDKPFEEARDEVHKALLKEKQQHRAAGTIRKNLEYYLRDHMKRNERPTLEGIQEHLIKRHVKVGTSGDQLISTDELHTIADIRASRQLKDLLEAVDQISPAEDRQKQIEKLTEFFDTQNPPMECETGLLRIRLAKAGDRYEPSRPRELRNASGEVDKALQMQLEEEIPRAKALQQAKEKAKTYQEKMRQGQTKEFKDEIVSHTCSYHELPRPLQSSDLAQGTPTVLPGEDGYQVLMLTKTEIPSRAVYDARPAQDRGMELAQLAMRVRYQRERFLRWLADKQTRLQRDTPPAANGSR